jgi:hypothetical protein
MERHYVILLALLALVLLAALRDTFLPAEPEFNSSENDSVIYLAYSNTCPHCHTLIDYIASKDSPVKVFTTTSGAVFKPVLDNYGVDWSFGVPMMFAIADGEFLGVEGFPDESQEVDGYFMGREFEQQLCDSRGGEPQLVEGEYRYCKLPNGFFLGNKYSVDYMLSVCESTQCTPI